MRTTVALQQEPRGVKLNSIKFVSCKWLYLQSTQQRKKPGKKQEVHVQATQRGQAETHPTPPNPFDGSATCTAQSKTNRGPREKNPSQHPFDHQQSKTKTIVRNASYFDVLIHHHHHHHHYQTFLLSASNYHSSFAQPHRPPPEFLRAFTAARCARVLRIRKRGRSIPSRSAQRRKSGNERKLVEHKRSASSTCPLPPRTLLRSTDPRLGPVNRPRGETQPHSLSRFCS